MEAKVLLSLSWGADMITSYIIIGGGKEGREVWSCLIINL